MEYTELKEHEGRFGKLVYNGMGRTKSVHGRITDVYQRSIIFSINDETEVSILIKDIKYFKLKRPVENVANLI